MCGRRRCDRLLKELSALMHQLSMMIHPDEDDPSPSRSVKPSQERGAIAEDNQPPPRAGSEFSWRFLCVLSTESTFLMVRDGKNKPCQELSAPEGEELFVSMLC